MPLRGRYPKTSASSPKYPYIPGLDLTDLPKPSFGPVVFTLRARRVLFFALSAKNKIIGMLCDLCVSSPAAGGTGGEIVLKSI
jgi:hypothetical protein